MKATFNISPQIHNQSQNITYRKFLLLRILREKKLLSSLSLAVKLAIWVWPFKNFPSFQTSAFQLKYIALFCKTDEIPCFFQKNQNDGFLRVQSWFLFWIVSIDFQGLIPLIINDKIFLPFDNPRGVGILSTFGVYLQEEWEGNKFQKGQINFPNRKWDWRPWGIDISSVT